MIGADPGLKLHLEQSATTLCTCWIVLRTDGMSFGFTDHDQPLMIGAVQCQPQTGYSASDVEQELGLNIDTMQVEGALSADMVSEDDLLKGRFDDAMVETWRVNWQQPEQRVRIKRQRVARIEVQGQAYRVELESLSARMAQPRGRYFQASCTAELGDARCRANLETSQFRASGTVLSVSGNNQIEVSGLEGFEPHWFSGGFLRWTSGTNAERGQEVQLHVKQFGPVMLTLPSDGITPAPGDGFVVTAGCDRTFATCRSKFANGLNFQGFPHMPGNDAGYAYATASAEFDGQPVVP